MLEYEQLLLLKEFTHMVNLLSQENLLSQNFRLSIEKQYKLYLQPEKEPLQVA